MLPFICLMQAAGGGRQAAYQWRALKCFHGNPPQGSGVDRL